MNVCDSHFYAELYVTHLPETTNSSLDSVWHKISPLSSDSCCKADDLAVNSQARLSQSKDASVYYNYQNQCFTTKHRPWKVAASCVLLLSQLCLPGMWGSGGSWDSLWSTAPYTTAFGLLRYECLVSHPSREIRHNSIVSFNWRWTMQPLADSWVVADYKLQLLHISVPCVNKTQMPDFAH